MPPFDLVVRNGTVIDGSGQPRRRADVGVRKDRIEAVEDLAEAEAAAVLDAEGKIVAPGFIDVHNHSEGWLLKQPHLHFKTSQGFTTEVLMSDGISYAPLTPETAAHWMYYLRPLNGLSMSDYRGWKTLADYLNLLDGRSAQNVIAQIPYANLRTIAMGWGRKVPDDVQMRHLQYLIRQGMEEGAAGLSTGLDYIVQCFATTDELAEACAALADSQGLYVTHVRYKKGTLAGVREAVEIGRRAGVPVHVSHLKAESPEQVEPLLACIDEAAEAVDFTFDVYPYVPGSSMLNALLPYEIWEDGPLAVLSKMNDPGMQRRFAASLEHYRTGPERIRLAWLGSAAGREHVGLSLSEYAERVCLPVADALWRLLIEENLSVLVVFDRGDDALVEPFVAHHRFMLGSDGIYFPDGLIHPRCYGSAPRVLGPLVRDKQLLSLEAAVHKLTSFPAQRFGLRDRGEIRPGAYADLVVFDAETITDQATYEQPYELSRGVEYVVVNGTPVVREGNPVELGDGEFPGRALRFRR